MENVMEHCLTGRRIAAASVLALTLIAAPVTVNLLAMSAVLNAAHAKGGGGGGGNGDGGHDAAGHDAAGHDTAGKDAAGRGPGTAGLGGAAHAPEEGKAHANAHPAGAQ